MSWIDNEVSPGMAITSRAYGPSARGMSVLPTATLAAGMALACPMAAAATGVDAQQAPTLDTVEVQATLLRRASSPKFTQPLQDTPQTIQVIDQQLFEQQGATTLTEALRNSAGVGTFYAGENGSTSTGDTLYMRGFDTSGSIFADGIRDLGAISRDLFNVESVEVEKGPAGTDNGRGAPTGAINTVTKQAYSRKSLTGALNAGVDDQKRATMDWNLPLEALPGSALRLNAMWQDSGVPGRDHVRDRRRGLASSVAFGLGSRTRWYLDALLVKQNNVPDGFVPTIGLPGWTPQPGLEQLVGHPVDERNFYGTSADHDDVTARMYTVLFEHDVPGSWKLTNTARWGDTRQNYLLSSFTATSALDADGNPVGNISWSDAQDLSSYTLARGPDNIRDQWNRILTDQLNLRRELQIGHVRHSLSAGVEFTREQQVQYGVGTSGSRPPASLYEPDWTDGGDLAWSRDGSASRGRTDTAAAYVFDTLALTPKFLLTGGLRVDRYRTTFRSTAPCNGCRSQRPHRSTGGRDHRGECGPRRKGPAVQLEARRCV